MTALLAAAILWRSEAGHELLMNCLVLTGAMVAWQTVRAFQLINVRILAMSILAAASLGAADLSRYREFQLGMNLPAVAKLIGGPSSPEARVVHQRPDLIQELDWDPGRYSSSLPDAGPVKGVLFSFRNGELFRMVVTYDRYKTDGLTAEDMVDAISANYGTATRPDAEIIFPSMFNERVKVIARWEDSQYSFNLVRSSYQPSFGMLAFSKRLETLAQAAVVEAIRLDKLDAPRKEADFQRKLEDENRVQQEKVRLVNKAGFRP